jgi:HEAT repeat protein
MDDPGAVPALVARLRDEDETAGIAGAALVRLGPTARRAVPLMLPLLAAPETRPVAHTVLNKLGPTSVPDLARALKEADPNLRQQLAWQLSRLGPWARPAVPELLAVLAEQRSPAVLAGGVVLQARNPWQAVLFCQAHAVTEEAAPQAVAVALASVDPARAGQAIPYLLNALQGSGPLREEAALALGRLGDAGRPALPNLLNLLDSGEPRSGLPAARALYWMGPTIAAVPTQGGRLIRR